MDFKNCPSCRSIRMFDNGKCQTCGYISVQMNSINALYTGSKTQEKPVRIYEKSKESFSPSDHIHTYFTDYSSGSDGGSNCD